MSYHLIRHSQRHDTTLGVFLNSLKMCCLHYRLPEWRRSQLAGPRQGEQWGGATVRHTWRTSRSWQGSSPCTACRYCTAPASLRQIPSGYYIQTMNSNLHLNGFLLPIGAMNLISILPLLLLVPLMECVTSCYLSMEKTPFSPARVITMGHACASLSVLVAGLFEVHRNTVSSDGYYLFHIV
ncbi:uncharacterized protein LOC112216166 isoform X1 [Oncorhynchus tshawytscha]|uniref:uncharacterized protein LOC112216166 isoform X1 n=1 Tax=Oncorhynchus tshawytscha TaxID=74940 RepID=UPI001C3DE69D|nr:uncharacterized protein LOC112216166 isoform X1 [Oncorhynchus tshawytscha]